MSLICFSLVALAWASCVSSQTPSSVRIDDSSVYSLSNPTGIQYSKLGWNSVTTVDASQVYQGTYTENRIYGYQLWFAFRGSAFTYYADRPPGFGAVTLSLDGGDNVNLNWTNSGTTVMYQQNIWSVQGLDQGDHIIVIGNANVNNATIGLDYFTVSSWGGNDISPNGYGPGASSVAQGSVLVDNESNGVSYSGSAWDIWHTDANDTTQAMFFNQTEHCTRTPGASASFIFNGTAVWHFADDFSGNSKVKFSIDGGEGQIIDTATTGHAWTGQKMFWSATGLAPTSHTLTLTHVGTSGDFACIDFFMYLPSSASPPSPTSTSTSSQTPTATPTPPSSSSTPVAAIAGGAAGGVALLALLILLVIYYKRRPSRRWSDESHHETYTGEAAYSTKQVNPGYDTTTAGHGSGQEYNPYANHGGGGSMSQTTWSGPTYRGHAEIQQ
ncbi:transmembrane protein [Ceratobasidium sp. AG-Ba]|nr:transmembrane protein [Ceratobasidium sp. AG-Ba]